MIMCLPGAHLLCRAVPYRPHVYLSHFIAISVFLFLSIFLSIFLLISMFISILRVHYPNGPAPSYPTLAHRIVSPRADVAADVGRRGGGGAAPGRADERAAGGPGPC